VPKRSYDEIGKTGEGDERRTKLGFQSFGAAGCDSRMQNHTRRIFYLCNALNKHRNPLKNNEIIGGGGDNHIAL
jgi:hypothetical protein